MIKRLPLKEYHEYKSGNKKIVSSSSDARINKEIADTLDFKSQNVIVKNKVTVGELLYKSFAYGDRLSFKVLRDVELDKNLYSKQEQAALLKKLFKLDGIINTKKEDDVEMLNALCANLLKSIQGKRNNKTYSNHVPWIGITLKDEKISNALNYSKTSWKALINSLQSNGYIDLFIGSKKLGLTSSIRPTKLFQTTIVGALKDKDVLLFETRVKDLIQFNKLTDEQRDEYLNSSPVIRKRYEDLLEQVKLINKIQKRYVLWDVVKECVNREDEGMKEVFKGEEGALGEQVFNQSPSNKDRNAWRDTFSTNQFKIGFKPIYKMIFGTSLDDEGRLYCQIQNTPSKQRLSWNFNGNKVIEKDFASCQIAMLYDLYGLTKPSGEMYDVEGNGKHREFWKTINMLFLSCNSRKQAMRSLENKVNMQLIDKNILPSNYLNSCLEGYFKAYEAYHQPLVDAGLSYQGNSKLMNLDGQIALGIMRDFSVLNKLCVCIHDSFVVMEEDEDLLDLCMRSNWKRVLNTSNEPKIKTKREEEEELTNHMTTQDQVSKEFVQALKERYGKKDIYKPLEAVQESTHVNVPTQPSEALVEPPSVIEIPKADDRLVAEIERMKLSKESKEALESIWEDI